MSGEPLLAATATPGARHDSHKRGVHLVTYRPATSERQGAERRQSAPFENWPRRSAEFRRSWISTGCASHGRRLDCPVTQGSRHDAVHDRKIVMCPDLGAVRRRRKMRWPRRTLWVESGGARVETASCRPCPGGLGVRAGEPRLLRCLDLRPRRRVLRPVHRPAQRLAGGARGRHLCLLRARRRGWLGAGPVQPVRPRRRHCRARLPGRAARRGPRRRDRDRPGTVAGWRRCGMGCARCGRPPPATMPRPRRCWPRPGSPRSDRPTRPISAASQATGMSVTWKPSRAKSRRAEGVAAGRNGARLVRRGR